MDWDRSTVDHVTVQGDLYDGRIGQPLNAGDIAVNGRNLVAKWWHTVSERSNVAVQLYYDRTHRDIPTVFGEDLDIYDVDLQHQARLGARHEVVWGLGYRLMNDRVANGASLAFVPAHVTRPVNHWRVTCAGTKARDAPLATRSFISRQPSPQTTSCRAPSRAWCWRSTS